MLAQGAEACAHDFESIWHVFQSKELCTWEPFQPPLAVPPLPPQILSTSSIYLQTQHWNVLPVTMPALASS